MKNKHLLTAAVLALALVPFMLLSFFNQPVGDDFWNTWMVKKYGFAGAQQQLFTTTHGRFSASFFMSFNSFTHGSVLSFKLWPVIFILAWVTVVYAIIRTYFNQFITRLQALTLAFLLTLVYYANVPGLHEGGYWMSGLACYQLPILFYLFYLPMSSSYNNQPAWKKYIFFPVYIFIAGGFHEMLAFMFTVISLYSILVKGILLKKFSKQYLLFTAASALAFIVQMASSGNRYKASLTAARPQLGLQQVAWKAVTQTGYHILVHCLLSPVFWLGGISVFMVANTAAQHSFKSRLPLKQSLWIVGGILPFLVLFPGLFVISIEDNIAPLRVMNVPFIFFTTGFYAATALYGASLGKRTSFFSFSSPNSAKKIAVGVIVLIISLTFSGNTRHVITTLISGNAYWYNQEVTERFQQIESCKQDSCAFTCLQHQPMLLCPVDICQNPALVRHLEKVYQKKLYKR